LCVILKHKQVNYFENHRHNYWAQTIDMK
jgi:hypothetical protein